MNRCSRVLFDVRIFNPSLQISARGLKHQWRTGKEQFMLKRCNRQDPVVPIENLKIGTPLSGSLVYDENLAETCSQDYEFSSRLESLKARGFLRFQKPYEPPSNLNQRLTAIVKSLGPPLNKIESKNVKNFRLTDSRLKYDLLSQAFVEFQHSVPNSMLYMIETIGDLQKFYSTPIRTTTPYDDLARTKDLPPNLHIQKEPVRFHPDTDAVFGGISAFPKSSTLVTGLRAKQKFKGFSAKRSWP